MRLGRKDAWSSFLLLSLCGFRFQNEILMVCFEKSPASFLLILLASITLKWQRARAVSTEVLQVVFCDALLGSSHDGLQAKKMEQMVLVPNM